MDELLGIITNKQDDVIILLPDEQMLPPQEVIFVWDWEWKDPEDMSHISDFSFGDVSCTSESSFGNRAHSTSDPEKEDYDATYCSIPHKEHAIIFKCTGSTHDLHAQKVLRCTSEQLHNDNVVPVKIFQQPFNQYNNKDLAFKCWMSDDWNRIGYITCEALDTVHDALNNNFITGVYFAWAKHMLSWTLSGPGYYAGINITKFAEWPAEVYACSSTR